jgi:hypothetical protein
MARRYRSYMATKKNGQGQLPIACTERERERESERERRSFETELVSWGQAVDGAWSQAGRARGGTTYLIRESAGSQITKRQLESAVASLDIDLESDQGILVGSSSRRHDCDCSRLYALRQLFLCSGGDVLRVTPVSERATNS